MDAEVIPSLSQTCTDDGILQPPSEIKDNIDKIAIYVSKNTSGEARVMTDLGKNPSFGFLHPGNPFFAYYRQKVRDERNTLEQKSADKEPGQPAMPADQSVKLEPPPRLAWILDTDVSKIPSLELDIIKLVAQFVSLNGRSFQMGLWNRESKNILFGFLQPLHPYHQLFQQLVDCYTKLIVPKKDIVQYHILSASNKQAIINQIIKRRDTNRSQMKTDEEKLADEEAERSAMASIDWNDAIIVETIAFDPNDDQYLPAPIEKNRIMAVYNLTKARDEEQVNQQKLKKSQENITGSVMDGIIISPTSTVAPTEIIDTTTPPAMPVPPTLSEPKTVPDYYQGPRKPVMMCPICRQAIPTDELEEHMKIELSRASSGLVDKQSKTPTFPERTAMVAEGDEIASHLTKMAKRRKDIFGDDEEELTTSQESSLLADNAFPNYQDDNYSRKKHANPNSNSSMKNHYASDTNNPYNSNGSYNNNMNTHDHIPKNNTWQDSNSAAPNQPHGNSYHPNRQTYPDMHMNRGFNDYKISSEHPYPAQNVYHPASHHHSNMYSSNSQNTSGSSMAANYRNIGSVPPIPDSNSTAQRRSLSSDNHHPPVEPKRAKVVEFIDLVPEKEWIEKHGNLATFTVYFTEADLLSDGRTNLEVEFDLALTIKDLKEKLSGLLPNSVPANKLVLKVEELGFLKDKLSLAHYNLKSGSGLILTSKERGGRRK